jgi:hypothetical protein
VYQYVIRFTHVPQSNPTQSNPIQPTLTIRNIPNNHLVQGEYALEPQLVNVRRRASDHQHVVEQKEVVHNVLRLATLLSVFLVEDAGLDQCAVRRCEVLG